MKKRWIFVAVADGAALLLLFWRMASLNARADYGMAALENVGQFVVCFILFQLALLLAVILAIYAVITAVKNRRK